MYVATAMLLSGDAALSLTDNSLKIVGADEMGFSNIAAAVHVIAAGLFVSSPQSQTPPAAALSTENASRVRIGRNNLAVVHSALSGSVNANIHFYSAVISLKHATTCVNVSQIAALELHHNRVTIDNCTATGSLSLYGAYWLSSSYVTLRDNASIAVHSNAITVQTLTAYSLNIYASYAGSSVTNMGGYSSVFINDNAGTVQSAAASNNVMAYGSFWSIANALMQDGASVAVYRNTLAMQKTTSKYFFNALGSSWGISSTTVVQGSASISSHRNTVAMHEIAADNIVVFGLQWSSAGFAAIDGASIAVQSNTIEILNATVTAYINAMGLHWISSSTLMQGDATAFVLFNAITIHNTAPINRLIAYGLYVQCTVSPTILGESAILTFVGNTVTVRDTMAAVQLHIRGLFWSVFSTVMSRGASMSVHENAVSIQNASVGDLDLCGFYLSSSSPTNMNGYASVAVHSNKATVRNATATSGLSAFGSYWSSLNAIAAKDGVSIFISRNSAVISFVSVLVV